MNCPKCGHPDYYQSLFGGGSCMNPTCVDASSEAKARANSTPTFASNSTTGPYEPSPGRIGFAANGFQCSNPVDSDDCPECGADPGECSYTCGQYEAPDDLATLVEDFGIECEAVYGANEEPCSWNQNHHPYRVTLIREEEDTIFSLQTDFFTGTMHGTPTAADVLYCLVMDAMSIQHTDSFEEWADNLGYDPDSRKAFTTYQACQKMATKVEEFLGDHLDTFANAEH